MKILLSKEELRDGVLRLADEITEAYQGRPLTIVGVLTGSIVFLADLIRLIDLPLRVGVVQASSYRGATTVRGHLELNAEMMPDVTGRDLLLVDDIFDTGHTLVEVSARMSDLGPSSIRTVVLMSKEGRQEVAIKPDFIGFQIPDEFVVGYGLDYEDQYRNLPYLAVLEEVDLSHHEAASDMAR